jgi:GMP synthase PP-ATPase subunit
LFAKHIGINPDYADAATKRFPDQQPAAHPEKKRKLSANEFVAVFKATVLRD